MSNECPVCGDTVVYNKESGDYQCGGCGDTLKREEIEASFAPPVEAPSPERVIAVNPQTGEWASFVRGDNGEWCRIVEKASCAPPVEAPSPERVIAVNPQTGECGSFVRDDNGQWCRIVKNADDAPRMVRRVPTNVDPLQWEVQWVSG